MIEQPSFGQKVGQCSDGEVWRHNGLSAPKRRNVRWFNLQLRFQPFPHHRPCHQYCARASDRLRGCDEDMAAGRVVSSVPCVSSLPTVFVAVLRTWPLVVSSVVCRVSPRFQPSSWLCWGRGGRREGSRRRRRRWRREDDGGYDDDDDDAGGGRRVVLGARPRGVALSPPAGAEAAAGGDREGTREGEAHSQADQLRRDADAGGGGGEGGEGTGTGRGRGMGRGRG